MAFSKFLDHDPHPNGSPPLLITNSRVIFVVHFKT